MPHPQWPFKGANIQWDRAGLNQIPLYNEANANGVTLTGMWYGGFAGQPSRANDAVGGPTVRAQQLRSALPGLTALRTLFNQHYFTDTLPTEYVRPVAKEFMEACTEQGFKNLWVLMDGPSQRQYAGTYGSETSPPEPGIDSRQGNTPGTLYWTHYYDRALIDADRVGTVPAVMAKIHESQVAGWTKMCSYLSSHPDIYATTIGFELINEPDSYAEVMNIIGDEGGATYYTQHCLNLIDLIDTNLPGNGHDIYIGGKNYSADWNVFFEIQMPEFGGRTPAQVFQDRLGDRLVASLHAYAGWMQAAAPTTMEEVRKGFEDTRWGKCLQRGIRMAITETNAQDSDYNNTSYEHAGYRKEFLFMRNLPMFRSPLVSFFWWPLTSWAEGSVIDARGFATFQNYHQNSLAGFLNVLADDNNPEWFTGPASGIRGSTRVETNRSVNAPTDPDYEEKLVDMGGGIGIISRDAADNFALGFGGAGVAVVQPLEDCNNFLRGGNGRNILYGSQTNDDHFSLGRGGGVVRCYGGVNRVNTNGGNNLVYGGSHWTMVSCYWGQATIVIDPVGFTRIIGFDPAKGDRLSFKGLLPWATLRAGILVFQDQVNQASETHLSIDFPQGGRLEIIDGANLVVGMQTYVLDYTDGWYGPGWVEPADYDPADFDLPIVPPPEVPASPNAAVKRDWLGNPVYQFAYDGKALYSTQAWS